MSGPKGYGFSAVSVLNRVSFLAEFGHFGYSLGRGVKGKKTARGACEREGKFQYSAVVLTLSLPFYGLPRSLGHK